MRLDVKEEEGEEEQILFYVVQSPPFEFHPENSLISEANTKPELASRRTIFSSSRCSSARDSLTSNASNTFPHKLALVEIRSGHCRVHNKGCIAARKLGDDEGGESDCKIGILERFKDEKEGCGFKNYFSFDTYDGPMWLALQLCWRLVVSLVVALLVFYVATKPPPPQISVQVGGVRNFKLAEGVDSSGVSTNIMRCNTTIEILIDNQSKVFKLHLLPPVLRMSFQHLTFAVSQGDDLVAERQQETRLEMYLGTRNKPMYGAGRMMQDMLDSKGGLPLLVEVTLVSNYRVVAGLVRPWYHHHVRCLLVVKKGYDSKNRTHHFNNTCAMFANS